MSAHAFLYHQSELLISAVFFVIILIEAHFCYRFGARRQSKHPDNTTQILIGFMPGALVTLMALFFAFVVSMAEVRFEARTQLVVDETNAIRSSYLRSKLLPDTEKAQIDGLLKNYVSARIEFYSAEPEFDELREIHDKETYLQKELWSHALHLSLVHPESIPIGSFSDSLQQTFDASEKQTVAYENHVPDIIVSLLLVVSLLVMASVGYAAGVSGGRHMIFSTALSLIIALTLFAILDIDRPRRGLARLDFQSLVRLQDRLSQSD
jgi:hypothetical protein